MLAVNVVHTPFSCLAPLCPRAPSYLSASTRKKVLAGPTWVDKHERNGRSDSTNAFLNANCVFCIQVEAHIVKIQEAVNARAIMPNSFS